MGKTGAFRDVSKLLRPQDACNRAACLYEDLHITAIYRGNRAAVSGLALSYDSLWFLRLAKGLW